MICAKRLIHLETKQVTVFMNESLNHWLKWFIQKNTAVLLWDVKMFYKTIFIEET